MGGRRWAPPRSPRDAGRQAGRAHARPGPTARLTTPCAPPRPRCAVRPHQSRGERLPGWRPQGRREATERRAPPGRRGPHRHRPSRQDRVHPQAPTYGRGGQRRTRASARPLIARPRAGLDQDREGGGRHSGGGSIHRLAACEGSSDTREGGHGGCYRRHMTRISYRFLAVGSACSNAVGTPTASAAPRYLHNAHTRPAIRWSPGL